MKIKKVTAFYALLVGIAMLLVCLGLWLSGLGESVKNIPISFSMAFTLDLFTAAAFLTAGIAVLARAAWAEKVFLAGMGAFCCNIILSFSSSARIGNTLVLLLCVVILVVGLILTLPILSRISNQAGH
jgi:hypothetical protein